MFNQKIAIITGASIGIGKALALELSYKGARVVLAARNTETLSLLASDIDQLGGEAFPIPTDLTHPNQVQHLIQATLDRWDVIDLLISNDGQYQRSAINELKLELL